MQDVNDRTMLEQYQKPSRSEQGRPQKQQAPFVVRGAPWDNAPDVSSSTDFPELSVPKSGAAPMRWGPPVKR